MITPASIRLRRLLAPAAALLAVAAVAAPAVAAEMPNRNFLGTLIDGKPVPPNPNAPGDKGDPGIEGACGLAVNFEGKVYVSDYYHHAVKVYLPGENPKKPFEKQSEITGVQSNGNGPCGLAVDFTDTLYVNYYHGPVATSGGLIVDPGPATGVATGPDSGDVYVDRRTSIAVYDAPVIPGEPPALEIDPGPGGALEDGYGIAVSNTGPTKGFVYVADAGDDTIKVYDPATPSAPVQVIDGIGTPQGGFSSLFDAGLAIDQSNGHLLVADNLQPGFTHPAAVVDEFNPEGVFRGQLTQPLISSEPTAIALNEAAFPPAGEELGELYVSSGNGSSSIFPPNPHPIDDSEATVIYRFGLASEGQTLTVSKSGAGTGTVESDSPGISCGDACKAEFNAGRTVKLTAVPAAGSVFAGWSGACSGTGSCQVILSGPAAVEAIFEPAPPALAARQAAAADAGDTTGAAGPAAPVATLTLGRSSVQGDTVLLAASAPGPGVLSATGSGLRPAARVADGGATTLRLHLNRKGRRALARSKTGRLAIRVRVVFRPRGGGVAAAAGRIVAFKRSKEGR